MIANLLCPGPSLANYTPQKVDLIVGVNRAAIAFACDAWLCGDPPAIQDSHEKVIGDPLLVTSTDGHHVCSTFKRDFGHDLWRGQFICWTEMLGYCPHILQWVMFTATAALVYCGWRGATQINVFGCDQSGTADFDGVEAGKNRSGERWKLEKEIWANLDKWLGERGVKVVKHERV